MQQMLYVNIYYVDLISKKVGWWQTYACSSKEDALIRLNRVQENIKRGIGRFPKRLGSFSAVIEESKGAIAFH